VVSRSPCGHSQLRQIMVQLLTSRNQKISSHQAALSKPAVNERQQLTTIPGEIASGGGLGLLFTDIVVAGFVAGSSPDAKSAAYVCGRST